MLCAFDCTYVVHGLCACCYVCVCCACIAYVLCVTCTQRMRELFMGYACMLRANCLCELCVRCACVVRILYEQQPYNTTQNAQLAINQRTTHAQHTHNKSTIHGQPMHNPRVCREHKHTNITIRIYSTNSVCTTNAWRRYNQRTTRI